MSLNLFAASRQWSTRPADERFWNLEEMHAACRSYRDSARTATVRTNQLRCEVGGEDGGEVVLQGPAGQPAKLTHWSFGQLANRVGAPADYLRSLPAELAARNLTHGLQRSGDDSEAKALFHANGSLICRCLTSDKYTRIFNHEVVERLLPLTGQGWRVPPARPAMENQPGARKATKEDLLEGEEGFGLSVKEGDMIAPAGLYASDHDMFAFMVNEGRRIEDGSDGGLSRGFFITNSEVGAASLKVTTFLYRHVCGNHIVWGAKGVSEIRIVHRGAADRKFSRQMAVELRKYSDASANDDELRIEAAKRFTIGATKDEVLDSLFAKKILPRKSLEQAYDFAVEQEQETAAGSPKTVWGITQGITRLSQEERFADRRAEIDRAAGKVLEMAF